MVTLLIDADVVAYQYSAAAQTNFDWGDGITSVGVDENYDPFSKAEAYINELQEKLEADAVIVCFSDPNKNWRKTVLPTYKGNRKSAKPELLMGVKAYLSQVFTTYQRPWLEGDDILGILSTHPKLIQGKKIIVTIDKDLQQIPGLLFNPDKDDHVRSITAQSGLRFFMRQTITGDTVDGYTGCPSVGQVGAERALCSAEDYHQANPTSSLEEVYWKAVMEVYESRGLGEVEAVIQARVARMCTYKDYDFNKKEVILWQPPKVTHLPVITAFGSKALTKQVVEVTAKGIPQQ